METMETMRATARERQVRVTEAFKAYLWSKEVEELDFYEVDTPQEHLLMEVLDSTGDGKTSETAICVISVDQEYEYLERKFPYNCLHVARQSLCDGIECLYFEENVYGIKCIYFDIKR